MGIEIRTATMNDYERLYLLLAEVDSLHTHAMPHVFRALPNLQAARSREYLSELLDDPDNSILLAEQSGQLVGAIITLVRDTPPYPILVSRRVANIDVIVIRQDQQGRGIGRALMACAAEWARSLGAQEIELSVYSFNQHAIQFYENLGYEEISKKMAKKL